MNENILFTFIFNNKVKDPLNLVKKFLEKNSIVYKELETYDFEKEECKIIL
jgi:hypothetical protein